MTHQWPDSAPRLELFHPKRGTIAGRPGLIRPDGSAMAAALPQITFEPCDNGTFTAWAYFCIRGSFARRFEVPGLAPEEAGDLLRAWRSCPEIVACERFGWWPEVEAPPRVRDFKTTRAELQELSLDDLEDL